MVLVELGVVEQRYRAVVEVLEGASVTEVARRNGVVRQTVHKWLRRYAAGGIGGLADGSCRPGSCPHQMPAAVEARVVALRREYPGWGSARIRYQLGCEHVVPVPGRSSVYRALVRHGLIDPKARRRRRQDYRRWERGRAMELWQMDVMGGVALADGTGLSVVTGIDDHSRFVVCAAGGAGHGPPVCEALLGALAAHGVPGQILTDNGKVFTARFGPGPGPVLFDRICAENGIRHLLTAPYAPTTTGKVERLHKAMRREFFRAHDREYGTIAAAQAALDAWVEQYNTIRPHQGAGMRPPAGRFALAQAAPAAAGAALPAPRQPGPPAGQRPPGVTRWVDQKGSISVAGFPYRVGPVLAGELVEVVCTRGLVEVLHRGVLVATRVQRTRPGQQASQPRQALASRRARTATAGPVVTRVADGAGAVSFAGTMYHAGRAWARHRIEVSLVAGSVQLACDGKVIRVHPARHDRAKEHGAFANPGGRPRKAIS